MQAIFSVCGARGRHDNRRACCLVQILLKRESVIAVEIQSVRIFSENPALGPVACLVIWRGVVQHLRRALGRVKQRQGMFIALVKCRDFFKSIIQFIFWLCDKAAKEKGGGPLMVQSLQSPRCELTQLRSWSMHWTLSSLSRSSCWVLEMISALLSINTVQWQRGWYWQQ